MMLSGFLFQRLQYKVICLVPDEKGGYFGAANVLFCVILQSTGTLLAPSSSILPHKNNIKEKILK